MVQGGRMNPRRNTRVYWLVCVAAVLVFGLAFSRTASAQTPTGSIIGTVLDAQGLPEEGADVTLTNQGTNYTYSTTTSSTGAFQFSSIDSGLYSLTATAAGLRASAVQH